MLNYSNLNDVEFEYLCEDVMSRILDVELRRFAKGRDGGIDLTDNIQTRNIVVQVKHYIKSTYASLLSSLKKELEKVNTYRPKQYYICCAKELTPDNISEIYSLFSDYMDSDKNIVTIIEIDDFLQKPENNEILKKHYKLWIESTGILQEIWNNDIFIDCESLLSDIEDEKRLFVRTKAFDKALSLLSKNKSLFITGNPGVGKTITSKMLAIYLAAEGYSVRYSTYSNDLNNLKKSLSRNPNTKEIILVDDCLGQAYFQMKESQSTELLALIKHINISKNKLLVLNSRITIFQEAKEKTPELAKRIDKNDFQIYTIDMNAISDLEKAKILYNHLAFSNIPKEHFEAIKKDNSYFQIIKHKNYNPRVIEFISNPNRYLQIPASNYFTFIIEQLNNPKEIWKDEYERKLQKTDRILLSSIYSFSDTFVDETSVRYNFEKRIEAENDIDLTINHYDASLCRLSEGFVKIVDLQGKKYLSMVNPSVNDYLDNRLAVESAEKRALIKGCTHIQQLNRLLSEESFNEIMLDCIIKHKLDDYIFMDDAQKDSYIAYYITRNQVLDSYYTPNIKQYIKTPMDIRKIFGGRFDIPRTYIVQHLLTPEFFDFYKIRRCLLDSDHMSVFLFQFDFESLVKIMVSLHPLFSENELKALNKTFVENLEESMLDYLLNVNAEDFDDCVDIDEIIEEATVYDECGAHIDDSDAVFNLEEQIEDAARNFVLEIISQLPDDIYYAINRSSIDTARVDIYGASGMITAHIDYDNYEYTPKGENNDNYLFFEITSIFNRDITQNE